MLGSNSALVGNEVVAYGEFQISGKMTTSTGAVHADAITPLTCCILMLLSAATDRHLTYGYRQLRVALEIPWFDWSSCHRNLSGFNSGRAQGVEGLLL